jgi:pyrroline-5-carboxylate reductase
MVLLGFIGTGHMGGMLIHKFIETEVASSRDIIASNRTREEAELLARDLSIMVGDNREVAKRSDVIFLCVKPLDIKGVFEGASG